MDLRGAISVFRFECRRTMTVGRLAAWTLLAAFPPLIVGLFVFQLRFNSMPVPPAAWGLMLFGLIPEVVCLLGLLLWATPIVQAELEGRTWIYLAVRPGGRRAVLLGKYMTAVTWTAVAAWCGLIPAVLIPANVRAERLESRPSAAASAPDAPPRPALLAPAVARQLGFALAALVALSCLAYGAMYCFIAVLFPKRAMVIAVTYTLLFEFLVSFVPAMINKFTVHYRLRSLLFTWMDWWRDAPEVLRLIVGKESPWQHLSILLLITVGFLTAALLVLKNREYVTHDDS